MKIEKIRQFAEDVIKMVDHYGLKDINVHEILGFKVMYDDTLSAIQELSELSKFSEDVIKMIDEDFKSCNLTKDQYKTIHTEGIMFKPGVDMIVIDIDSYNAGYHYGTGALGPAQTMFDYIMIAEKFTMKGLTRGAERALECMTKLKRKYAKSINHQPMDPTLAKHKAYYFIIGALLVDLRDLKNTIDIIHADHRPISILRKRLKKYCDITEDMIEVFSRGRLDRREIYKLDMIICAIENAFNKEDIIISFQDKGLSDTDLKAIKAFYEMTVECLEETDSGVDPFEIIECTRVKMNMQVANEINSAALTTSSKMIIDQYGIGSLLATAARVCMIQYITNEKCKDVEDIYSLYVLHHGYGGEKYKMSFTDEKLVNKFRAFRFLIPQHRVSEVHELYTKLREEK